MGVCVCVLKDVIKIMHLSGTDDLCSIVARGSRF